MLPGILSIYIMALLSPLIASRFGRAGGWLIAALPAGLAIYFGAQIPGVAAGRPVMSDHLWITGLDMRLAFALDGLSLLMALLITGIGALVVIFAEGYLPPARDKGRFYAFLLMFMASMLGLVLTDDLIVMFVFWELTSFSSFMLIGHYHDRAEARAAALQALVVTAGGGLALLCGLVMLGAAGGSFRFSELIASGGAITQHELYLPIVALVLLGAFTKSAQFPFHFWLPNAMEAPAPVSAYLHAATMVKAGIYLMARLSPILGGTLLWQYTLIGFGGATVIAASLLSLHQKDMKRLLAYSTVSSLGMMTFLLGLGTAGALTAMVVFLLAHALYKGSLFLVAGAVDHATGERQVHKLGGLRRSIPILSAAAVLAAISMAGLPPLFGFIGKEGFLQAAVDSPWAAAASVLAVAGSAVLVAVGFQVGLRPFIGAPSQHPHLHAPGLALLLGPTVLATGGAVLGLWPGLASPLLGAAAAAATGRPTPLKLALWHGPNVALLLSAIALVLGLILYILWDRVFSAAGKLNPIGVLGPARAYAALMKGVSSFAVVQTNALQSGYLRRYMLLIVCTTIVLVGGMLGRNGIDVPEELLDVRPHEFMLAALIIVAAIASVRSQSWMAAVAAMGVVGFGVAAVFILFGAPDLAMTQFLVETLTVILFVLIIYHLPKLARMPARSFELPRILVAIAAGVLMAVLVLAAAHPSPRHVSEFYMNHSLPDGQGHNVVNVILVDFRGLDTLGEITVLAAAALDVLALVQIRRVSRRSI